ncbi:MAG: hypothetical protein O3B84_00775, partial [Chloroflexi bacterium]|nr:hypothetical protein [Chloroflexota bacterium]
MVGAFFPLVIRRMVAYAPLLAPVLIGTLIATAITSGIVIYGEALRNVGLAHAISNTNSDATDLRLRFESTGAGAAARNQSVGLVESEVSRRLGGLAGAPTTYTRSDTFLLSRPGETPGDLSVAPRGSFQVLSDAEQRFELVDGRWPAAGTTAGPGQTLGVEAVALEAGAEALGLSGGDSVAFAPFWEDITPHVDVLLTGVVRIRDPLNPVWSTAPFSRLSADPTLLNTLPVLVDEATLVSVLGVAFPEMGASHLWTYPLRTNGLRASNTTDVVARLRGLEVALSSRVRAFRQETALTSVLTSYDMRLRFIQVPLAIVLLLVEAMVLYAVAFLATLAMERQRADAALVRSRGAHTAQVFYLYAAQGVLISAVATVFGPILAAVAVSSFGYFPAFVSFTEGAPIAVSLSPSAFLFAAIGGAL